MDFETRVAGAKRAIREASIDGVQRRSVPALFEVRTKDDGTFGMRGHAAVYDVLSENLGGFREKIDPGAFDVVLDSNPDVRALFNHDPNLVLARTTNGTLRLHEDERGLVYEADIAPTSVGNDLRVWLERGDITQSSFAFRVGSGGDSWEEDEDTGALIRTIHSFSALFDVSPVTYPAYPAATAAPRSSTTGTSAIWNVMLTGAADNLKTSTTETERKAPADAQEQGRMAVSEERVENPDAWRASARDRELRMRRLAHRL